MQYMVGIAFGIVAMLGFGIVDIFLALASKANGHVRAAFLFFVVMCIGSIISAFWLFTPNNFTLEVIVLLVATGIVSFIGFASFSKGFEVGNVSMLRLSQAAGA